MIHPVHLADDWGGLEWHYVLLFGVGSVFGLCSYPQPFLGEDAEHVNDLHTLVTHLLLLFAYTHSGFCSMMKHWQGEGCAHPSGFVGRLYHVVWNVFGCYAMMQLFTGAELLHLL